jgi:dTDP-4-amino-4,6-dideoxygalactose transaminase
MRPWVGEEEAQAAAEAVRSGWLSQGPRVEQFESLVAGYVGAHQAIATSSGTAALHLALLAAGVQPGDDVICPSFSFIATANAIIHARATPVFVDIDRRTYTIDPQLIEQAITSRTTAIVPVDQIGLAADLPAIGEIARARGLRVVEDAAPALGASIGEGRVGNLSDFTCFSFHPRKSITAGEGGMITTDNEAAAERLRGMRSHAVSTSAFSRHASGTVELEEYRELGWNYRLSDVQAAIGVAQMGKLDVILAERRRLAERYNMLFAGDPRLETPYEPLTARHTYQSYCVWLHSSRRRASIMAELAHQGIATRRGVMAAHLEPYYRSLQPRVHLPVTERATAATLLLPLYVGMTDEEQDTVVAALRRALG